MSQGGKLLVFGDSIAFGLGVRRKTYPRMVSEALNLDLVDLSGGGMTVVDSLRRLGEAPTDPTIVLIAHGVTEPIIRPTARSLRWLPRRWQRRGWMDPRPYFSTRFRRRISERLESEIRWRIKNFLIRTSGGTQVLSLDEYIEGLKTLVASFNHSAAEVLIIGPPDISERYFPGSQAEQIKYEDAASRVGNLISLKGRLDRQRDFLLDGFHPNDHGHLRISHLILQRIAEDA